MSKTTELSDPSSVGHPCSPTFRADGGFERLEASLRFFSFEFYPDRFLGGTSDMSQAEVGAYIRLLCHQFNRGSIPVATERQQNIAGGPVPEIVLAKFEKCEDGLLRNRVMEEVRRKRIYYSELQSQKGKLSAESRNRGSTAAQPRHQPEGQPNVNLPIPYSLNNSLSLSGGSHPALEAVKTYAAMIGIQGSVAVAFWDHFEASGWIDKNGHPIANWQAKLRTWATKERAQPLEQKHQSGETHPANDFWKDSKRLEQLNSAIAEIENRSTQDAFGVKISPKDKAHYAELKSERKALKKKLNL